MPHEHIMGVSRIVYAAPPVASLSSCLLSIGILFVGISLVTLALVTCMRWLRRPTGIEHIPPLLRDIRHCKTKVIHHCASVNGFEERSGRPNGHIRRDAECRARGSSDRLQRLKVVACEPFLRSICSRIDISRVHSEIWCLLGEAAQRLSAYVRNIR